ncbi:hypothetical protein KCU98_g5657, partial [Aureobasidium melanogenum]
MARDKFLVTATPYALEAIALASLVPDRRCPDQDAFKALDIKAKDFTKTHDSNFISTIDANRDSSVSAAVTRLFSAMFSSSKQTQSRLTANGAYVYKLNQPKVLFQQLCENSEARDWLEDGCRQDLESYFVVGFRTLVDAKVEDVRKKSHSGSGKVSVPTEAVAGPTGGALNVELGADTSRVDNSEASFEAKGERVVAILYRKVHLSSVSGTFESARLSKDTKEVTWSSTSRSGIIVDVMQAEILDVDDTDFELTDEVDLDRVESIFVLDGENS